MARSLAASTPGVGTNIPRRYTSKSARVAKMRCRNSGILDASLIPPAEFDTILFFYLPSYSRNVHHTKRERS